MISLFNIRLSSPRRRRFRSQEGFLGLCLKALSIVMMALNWIPAFARMTMGRAGMTTRALATLFLLTSCAPSAKLIAEKHHFTDQAVKGGKFLLQTYQKVTNPSLPYAIYIEGDGLAFKNKRTISDDPTPIHPVMLSLAVLDTRPNVVYLARPCQYLLEENRAVCDYHYWTSKRMSEDSVAAMNDAINTISHGRPIDLIGYSGGGGVAILVAARNPSVRSIITVAGNLDHVTFNQYHHVPPMKDSLNPIDYALKVNNIPQLHLSGQNDKIVPTLIAKKFVEATNSTCAYQEIVANTTHQEGWGKIWSSIFKKVFICK